MNTGLHIGSGGLVLPDFLNTDIDLLDGVDMVLDASKIPYPFKDGEFEKIYSSHMVEHLHKDILPEVIKEWVRVLKPRGVAIIDCPDLKQGLKLYHDKNYSWNKLMDLIFGNNERPTQHHLWGWTYDTLAPLFIQAGFSKVQEVTDFEEYHKTNFNIPTFRIEAHV
ncbi:MAG: class I SAM-dependent methyltransferase [Nitrospiria bacterium]